MQRTIAIAIALLTAASIMGCGFIKRSPETYRHDTQALLGTRKDDIKRCYNAVVKADPTAKGNVTVKFTVKKESGAITATEVTESDAPQAVQDCVTENIMGLVLGPPDAEDGIATFTYEFHIAAFTPAG